MLRQEIRELDVSLKNLRSFGLIVGGVLVTIAGVVLWHRDWIWATTVYGLAGIGITLAVLGLAAPVLLRPVYRVWMALALILGFIMTQVLLTLVFFLMVTPIGFLMRVLGKDPLCRTRDAAASSYWIQRAEPDPSPARLEKYY